jgi:hypothetical protein
MYWCEIQSAKAVQCFIDNAVYFSHLAMFIAEMPEPKGGWFDWSFQVCGNTVDLAEFRPHATHQLAVYDEYGNKVET